MAHITVFKPYGQHLADICYRLHTEVDKAFDMNQGPFFMIAERMTKEQAQAGSEPA
jgi:hypothetical protein